jgi:hypothetical protein
MLKKLCPREFADSFKDVDYASLRVKGVQGIIFDVDNTLEGYEANVPSAETSAFLFSLTDMGFKICLVSNNSRERIEMFNSVLSFPALHKAGKPSKKAVFKAAELMGVPVEATAIVGDQIFTDVYCGNRLGIHTVLVSPVTLIDPFVVKIKRIPERLLVKYFKNRDKIKLRG